MITAQELQRRLHACIPLFIVLDDEMRLSIIKVLTEETLDSRQTPGPTHFKQYGLNVNEITRWTSLSRPAMSHHLKILKKAGIVGVRQEGTANYYCLTLRESNHRLMRPGYRLEGFLCQGPILKFNSTGHTCIRWHLPDILLLSVSGR